MDERNPNRLPVLRLLGDRCLHLAEVRFGSTTVDMDDLRYFLNARRNTLKSIGIRWTMHGRRCVVSLLAVCVDSLEKLELYHYYVLHDEAREAFITLGKFKNLQELLVTAATAGFPPPPGVVALTFKTGVFPKLRRLALHYKGSLDDETVIAVSCGCPALRELVVPDAVQISDAAFSQIYRLEHLEILHISNCRSLGGALFPYLAGLMRLHTLKMTHMDFRKLQPGLSSILELSSLRNLTIDSSNVTGIPFDKFPGKLLNLRKLCMNWCRSDCELRSRLSYQMPSLKIYGFIRVAEPPLQL